MDIVADHITLSKLILHDQLSTQKPAELTKIGDEFARYCNCYSDEATHKLLKDVVFGERPWMVIGFCRWKRLTSSKLWVRSDQVQYSLQLFCKDSLDTHGMPLIVAEALKYFDDVLVIDSLISCYDGAGKESLDYILSHYAENNFLLSAVPGMYGDRELEKYVLDYNPRYRDMKHYFEDLGFETVEQYLGEIDGEVPMMKTPTPLAEVFSTSK